DHLRPRRPALWWSADDDVAGAQLQAVPAVAVVDSPLVAAHGRHSRSRSDPVRPGSFTVARHPVEACAGSCPSGSPMPGYSGTSGRSKRATSPSLGPQSVPLEAVVDPRRGQPAACAANSALTLAHTATHFLQEVNRAGTPGSAERAHGVFYVEGELV